MADTPVEQPPAPKGQRRSGVNWLKVSLGVNVAVAAALIVGGVAAFLLHQSDTNPNFCALCHNMTRYVNSYLTGRTMDSVHAQANVGCKECHSDYTIDQEVASLVKYVTGSYDQSMPQRTFADPGCLQCHISMKHQADRTDFLPRNPHLSHWPNLRCTICHRSHGEQVDYCNQCHDNGGQRMTGGPIIPRAQNPWAK